MLLVQKKENQNQQTLTKHPPVTALHILNSTLERLDVSLTLFQVKINIVVMYGKDTVVLFIG